jgi:hypothetical protein
LPTAKLKRELACRAWFVDRCSVESKYPMRTKFPNRSRCGRLALLALISIAVPTLIAACTQILQTSLNEVTVDSPVERPLNCHSSLGAYYLPKTFIHVMVSQISNGGKVLENRLDLVEAITRADTNRMFCLDYLASAFADDQISVQKTSATKADPNSSVPPYGSQLLQTVASNSVDQTSMIVRTLIKATFVALSGFRANLGPTSATNDQTELLADFEFDPFDQAQSTVVNEQLSKYGICLVLETYTFGQPTRMADHYCRNPRKFMNKETAFNHAYVEFNTAPLAPITPGILYRPRASYQLSIYAKDDPQGRAPWLLRRTMQVQLENMSPILSIGVDRAMFTLKQIALIFDKGTLENVCINKKSEAVEAVKIPLEIVKGITSLPTEILKIQYDNISKSQQLAKAENDLMAAQKQLIATQNGSQNSVPSTTAPAAPGAFNYGAAYTDTTAPTLPTNVLSNPFAFSNVCNKDATAYPITK